MPDVVGNYPGERKYKDFWWRCQSCNEAAILGVELYQYHYSAGVREHCSKLASVLLGDVPALPGVNQAYVQVGTGRGAPQ